MKQTDTPNFNELMIMFDEMWDEHLHADISAYVPRDHADKTRFDMVVDFLEFINAENNSKLELIFNNGFFIVFDYENSSVAFSASDIKQVLSFFGRIKTNIIFKQ